MRIVLRTLAFIGEPAGGLEGPQPEALAIPHRYGMGLDGRSRKALPEAINTVGNRSSNFNHPVTSWDVT